MRKSALSTVLLVSSLAIFGCSDDSAKSCDVTRPTSGCDHGQVCEVVGGKPACAAPLVIRGHVLDPTGGAIANARVAVVDGNDAPASGTTTSDATGAYELRVPTPRAAGGAPLPGKVKLHASAAGFTAFPSGLQRSLPIELSTAMMVSGTLVIANAATEVVLTPVSNPASLGSIAGTVQNGPGKSGALVVADGAAAFADTDSDSDGDYEIFNLAPGTYTVSGYAAGVQLMPAMATVTAGARTTGINLVPTHAALGTVNGSVDIVNGMGASQTSVVLVVESTFNDTLKRGDVPPGLRAPRTGDPTVSGSFSITDVPDGKYVVLAAFENDGLVRDPDTSIGGTQIVHVSVAGAPVDAGQFKVTGALPVISPGAADAPDVVTGTPNFMWGDDSSEDKYTLDVFNTQGVEVWGPIDLPSVSGSASVTAAYGGPPLTAGYFQFRATSWHKGKPISQTEDLRGVFIIK